MRTAVVVDDNPQVRLLVARVLESMGCAVRQAGSADEALAAVSGGPVDLLVTDVSLPGGNGPRVAHALRARCPRVAVLYVSGHDPAELRRIAERDGLPAVAPAGAGELFLRKPFGLAELRDAAGRLLSTDLPAP